jgi:predicted transcriptional regulator
MKDFRAIIESLREYLAKDGRKKVYDKDIAKLLGISQAQFATIKKRNTTPFAEVLEFCHREGLSCCELFFD